VDEEQIKKEMIDLLMKKITGGLSDKVVEYGHDPRNCGTMGKPDSYAKIKGPCGDTMEMFLKVRNDKIVDISYTTDGCMTSHAAGSAITVMAKSKTVRECIRINQSSILEHLDGMPERLGTLRAVGRQHVSESAAGLRNRKEKMNRALKTHSESASSKPLITIICDNYITRDDLEASWGFSCLIKDGGKNILFDTGGDGIVLLENMAKLSIEPASIDLMMISHQHWDHTGGIYYILNARRNLPVCVPRSFSTRFKEDMKRYGAELIEVEKAGEILSGLYTTGDLEGPIREQAAILKTSAGTAVITGCAHPGIIEIVKTAKIILPDNELALVAGGFHLFENKDEDVLKIIARFKKMGVRYAAASHCTGENARAIFANEYGDHFINLGAGSMITFKNLM